MTQQQFDDALNAVYRYRELGYEHYNARQLTSAREQWVAAAAVLEQTIPAFSENLTLELHRDLLVMLSTLMNNVGVTYKAQGKLEKALENYHMAYEINYGIEPRSAEIAIDINNIGGIYKAQGKLEEALDCYRRAYGIDYSINPRSTQTASRLNNIGSVYQEQGKLNEALENYVKAYKIDCSINPQSTDSASDLSNIGSVYQTQGKLADALENYSKAYEIDYYIAPRSNETATRLNNIGSVYKAQGKLEEAIKCYRNAYAIDYDIEPWCIETALDISNIGSVYYIQGKLADALEYFVRAYAIDYDVAPRSKATAIDLNNIGSVYQTQGKLADALENYSKAYEIDYYIAPRSNETATRLNNIGSVYKDQGKLEDALENFLRAYEINYSIAPRSADTGRLLCNIGSVYQAQGKLDEALENYRRALGIHYEIEPRSRDTAIDLNNVGTVYQAQGKLEEALENFRKAYEINYGIEPRSTETAIDLNNIGTVFHDMGKLAEALECYHVAYEIDDSIAPQSLAVARLLNNIGVIYQAHGMMVEALEKFRTACEIHCTIEPRSTETASLLNNIGSVYKAQDKLTEAQENYEKAVLIVEGLRRTAGGFRGADSLLSENSNAYIGWINVLFARNNENDRAAAFHVAERFRSRTLAERMTERAIQPTAQTEEQRLLLSKAENLRFELASALDQSAKARLLNDELLLAEATRRVQQIESSQEVVESELHRAFPEYAELAYPEPVTLAEVQQSLLDPGTLMLSYLQSGSDLYLWAVRQKDYEMLLLPIDPQMRSTELGSVIGRFHGRAESPEDATSALGRLSASLIGAVPSRFWSDVTRVLIIPTDELSYLPFEMLLRQGTPIGVNYEVSYAPSATLLRTLRSLWDKRAAPDWEREFLGIGDPDIPDSGDSSETRAGAGKLPGTRYELETIAHQYGSRSLPCLGPDATEANAFALAPKTRYIQFATHGLFDSDEPLNSFLLLSPPLPEDSSRHDNRLCVHEMFGLKLNAELVVCSACVTGLSQQRAGEGIVGMSTALLTAGAKCVLTTLWPVNDATMSEFMILLYEYLEKGVSVGQALKLTRTEMRTAYDDPFHWAPVVATGLT